MFKFRLFWICFNPFIKRLMVFEPILYKLFAASAIISASGVRVSKKGTVFSLFLIFYLLFVDIHRIVEVIPIVALLLFLPFFYRANVANSLKSFYFLFGLITLYALYQKIFGYTFIELNWIYSGLGTVGKEGYFVREDIRPLSFLAGTPELALFYSLFFYHFYKKEEPVLALFCIFMVFICGSRGVILALVISIFLLLISKHIKYFSRYSRGITMPFLLNFLAYLALTFIGPLIAALSPGSRLLVFGTFNARLETAIKFYLDNKDGYFVLPFSDTSIVYDNAYLSLVSIFTVFGLIALFYFLNKKANTEAKTFSLSLAIGYSFYSDLFLSFFSLFFILAIYFYKDFKVIK